MSKNIAKRLAALDEVEALCRLWEPSVKRDLMVQKVVDELRADYLAGEKKTSLVAPSRSPSP